MLPDLWYRNAVVYNVDLETFQDSDGDGCGDFEGLTRRVFPGVQERTWTRAHRFYEFLPDLNEEVNVERQRRERRSGRAHRLAIDAFGYRWYAVGNPDASPHRRTEG